MHTTYFSHLHTHLSTDTDLHSATKSGILKPIHKQYIMYQLLKVTKYLHSGNVIHRDLKVRAPCWSLDVLTYIVRYVGLSPILFSPPFLPSLPSFLQPSNVLLNAECFVKVS